MRQKNLKLPRLCVILIQFLICIEKLSNGETSARYNRNACDTTGRVFLLLYKIELIECLRISGLRNA